MPCNKAEDEAEVEVGERVTSRSDGIHGDAPLATHIKDNPID